VTTIVYRDGVMAADSLICDGGIRVGTVRKITRSADGGLVSACGNLNEMVRFQDWAARGFPADARPEMRAEDFEAVVAHPDGRIFWYDKDLRPSKRSAVPRNLMFIAAATSRLSALGADDAGS
jgi:hypothetical protein